MKYCEHIAHVISFNEKDILPCCTPGGTNPPAYYNARIESSDVVNTLDISEKQKEFFDILNGEDLVRYSCFNCIFCKEVEQLPNEEEKINTIFLRKWTKDDLFEETNISIEMNYDSYNLIKKLYEANKIDTENLQIKIQCDDLSKATDIDSYIELFNQYGGRTIHVGFKNNISFNENIAKLLPLGKASINFSLDAATSESYKKVRGTENFELNVSMLKKYAEYIEENKYALCIHYTLHKNKNDNKKDIDAFLALMKELGIFSIGIRINNENLTEILKNNNEELDNYKNLITYFYEEANKSGFYLDNDSCIEQNFVLAEKPKKSFFKSIFGFFK